MVTLSLGEKVSPAMSTLWACLMRIFVAAPPEPMALNISLKNVLCSRMLRLIDNLLARSHASWARSNASCLPHSCQE